MKEIFPQSLGSIYRIKEARSRSISAENPTGSRGGGARATEGTGAHAARDLGKGWKVSPSIEIEPGTTSVIADIEGPGIIQSMWLTGTVSRDVILKIYWDNQDTPSVLTPLPDFFAHHWAKEQEDPIEGPLVRVNALPISVNPNKGLNSFWPMPFRRHCRITLSNIGLEKAISYYQVNYSLEDVDEHAGYFHAHFRRVNPLPYKEVYTILDGVEGRGHYVGCSMGWGINNDRWWGEGEIKFYMDGDKEYPTICGTGLEDYFGGAYDWDVDGEYITYSTPFLGMHQLLRSDGHYSSQHRHSVYRYHIMDPVRFTENLRVTIQALGWRRERRYLPGMHDICSVAFWYQALPAQPLPSLPDRDGLEVI